MTNSEVIQRLQATPRGRVSEVARQSGVPTSTLYRILSGETPSPRIDTIDALRNYFQRSGGVQ